MELTMHHAGERLDTLNACLLIEETCSGIYRYFASLFSDRKEIAAIWSELADEEDRHAEQFRQAIHSQCRDSRCADDENFLIQAILDQLKSFMAEMKQHPPNAEEAFIAAAILEQSIEKYHVAAGKLLVNPQFSELLSTMAENDRRHREIMQHVT